MKPGTTHATPDDAPFPDDPVAAYVEALERGATASVADVDPAAASSSAAKTPASGDSGAAGDSGAPNEQIAGALRAVQLLRSLRPAVSDDDDAEPVVPGFRIQHLLGAGGLGRVYLATDLKLGRQVAIKLLRISGSGSAGRAAAARILDEARKAARVRDRSIVTVHAVVDEGPCAAIILERVEGFPMDRATANLAWSERARLLSEVARALSVAHANGLIHRDLKPENVLVTPEREVKLLDFGLALSEDEGEGAAGLFQGTPLYASPEQARGEPLTTASDVFSLGALIFKVLTGSAPFPRESTRAVLDAISTENPPFPRDVAEGVPEDLQAICLACLERDPERRPTAVEVHSDLERYLLGEPIRLRPALYRDTLRNAVASHARDLESWARLGLVSEVERDRLDLVYRRILADEDHWIVDARRVSILQLVFYASSWTVVVASVLLVWLARASLGPFARVALPALGELALLTLGVVARRRREWLASGAFLAGAVLALAPAVLALLGELEVLAQRAPNITQLLGEAYTNQQVLASAALGLVSSVAALRSLKLTGFAWTTAVFLVASYLGGLLLFGWLDRTPDVMALWCLPLVGVEALALVFERRGRVRWAAPFHLVALAALVISLDVVAVRGPTLELLGWEGSPAIGGAAPFLDESRIRNYSLVLNGVVFLGVMLVLERSPSLDLRRGARLLELVAPLHVLGPLYVTVQEHRAKSGARMDLAVYLAAVTAILALSPGRGRWRFLLLGLGGIALGAHLAVDLELLPRVPLLVGLGAAGVVAATAAYTILRRRAAGDT